MAQLIDVIFNDLRSSKKSVNRLLSLGVLFALIGHFSIIEPYFQYKAQEQTLLKQRDKVKEIGDSLGNIQQQVIDYPGHLRNVKELIKNALWSHSSPDTLHIGEISLTIKNREFQEAVGLYVENWFPHLMGQFKKPVSELGNLAAVTDASKIIGKVLIMADEAVRNFQTELEILEENDPEIWKDYTGPREAAATQLLQGVVEDAFGTIQNKIPALQTIMGDSLKKVESNLGQLEPRIKSLVSKFGPFTVRLTDFIVLFPLFIVGLLVMITAVLHKSSCLYIALWRGFTKDNKAIDRGIFLQFADCWYLPPYTCVQPLLLIALLTVISGLFVRAGFLAILTDDAELFAFMLPVVEFTTQNMFTGAYVFGTLVIVACFGLIVKTLRKITQELIE